MPAIKHEREGIMVDFNDLSDEQRIERFGQLAGEALARYGLASATLTHRSYTENVRFRGQVFFHGILAPGNS